MKRVSLLLLLFFIGVSMLPAWAAEKKTEYSALQKYTEKGKIVEGMIYVGQDKKRMEMDGAAQIFRFDKGVIWILMPARNMYMEQSIKNVPGWKEELKILKKEKVGKETINGIKTTHYKTVGENSQGKKFAGESWLSDEGIAIRNDMQADDGSGIIIRTELKDLKIGKQDDSLFEVPAGYIKFAMPMGMPPMRR